MPKAHLSNVAEPWGHAALQEDILIRQTRFSYLILKGSACGVFGASSSALLWRGSDGYWGAKSPCLRNRGVWSSSWAWGADVVGLRDWPGAGGAEWGFVTAAAQPHAHPSALLCAQSWGL